MEMRPGGLGLSRVMHGERERGGKEGMKKIWRYRRWKKERGGNKRNKEREG